MDPYREHPGPAPTLARDRGASYRAARKRLVGAALGIAATAALLPTIARSCRTQSPPGVPPELLTAAATFPPRPSSLQPAVPLEPLLVADAPDRLAVLSPRSTAQNLRAGSPLVIRFNRPMVEGAAVGKPVDPSLLVFSEPTKGKATWTSRSTLSFEPDAETWSRSHVARLSLSAALRSLAGEAIEDPLEHTIVFDDGPRLTGRAGAARLVAGAPVSLWFSGKVEPAALEHGLMVYEVGGGRRMLPFGISTARRDARGATRVDLSLRAGLEPGAKLAVAVAPPLTGDDDAPHVIQLELAPEPRIEGFDCPEKAESASACEYPESPGKIIDIEESLRVRSSEKLAALGPRSVVVTPPLDEMRTRVEGEQLIVVEGAFAPGQVYEVRFEGLEDDEGHALARTPPIAVRSAGKRPEIRVRDGRLTFERDAATTLAISGIHVDAGEARVAAIPQDGELSAFVHPQPLVATTSNALATASLASLLPDARPNRWGSGALDWAALAPDRSSMAIVSLLVDEDAKKADAFATTFVQRTDLGIDAKVLPRGVSTWVTSIATGRPVPGAQVTVADAEGNPIGLLATDEAGVAWLPVFDPSRLEREVIVRATHAGDRALLMIDPRSAMSPRHFGVAPGARAVPEASVVASVFTDRGIVRPGETFHAKVLVREPVDGALVAVRDTDVVLAVFGGPNEAPLFERVAKLSAFGTADATFALDAGAPPGNYRVEARVRGELTRVGEASFMVGDYRPPTFRVDLSAPDVPLMEKDTLRVDVEARYLFGPAAAGRSAHFQITRTAADAPHGWEDYTFAPADVSVSTATMGAGELALDAAGHATVTAPVAIGQALRAEATVEVSVKDVSGQSTSARRTLMLYPAAVEVGVREVPTWIEPGGTLDIAAIVVDHAGASVAGRTVEARIVREGWHRYWEWSGGRSDEADEGGENDAESDGIGAPRAGGSFQSRRTERAEVVHRCTLTSAAEAVHCTFPPSRSGTYVLEATTKDDAGRTTTASQRVYVAGPDEHPDRDRPGATVELSPKERALVVGDTAEIAFESPFPDAEALLEVHRDGVLTRERRRVAPGGNVFRFPVTAEMVPNAFVSLSLVRPRTGAPARRIDLDAPDLRVGLAELSVRPAASPLRVAIAAPERASAGAEVHVDVDVTDASGRGVQAEVALYAVDEGTLRVTGYETPAAEKGFYPRMAPSFAWDDLRRSLVSRVTEPLLPGAGGDGGGAVQLPPEQLERFEPTPLWLPELVTDASGHATATLALPERATQYRIMAVVADAGIRTGHAEETIVATMPVVVRPVLPVAVTAGDRFEAVAFVHNTGKDAIEVDVTPTIGGVARETRTIRIGAESDARVSEWVDATAPGDLPIAFATATRDGSTEARGRVPVAPRARVVRSSAVGAVKDARTITVSVSEGATTPVTLAIASHPFVGFDVALDVVLASPDAGVEATASTLVALSAYARLGAGERPGRLSDEEIARRGASTVDRLASLQSPSGGFGSWTASDAPDAYLTALALHALSTASRSGLAVRDDARLRARRFLAERVRSNDFLDQGGTEGGGHDQLAFALRVLSEEAEPDLERIGALFAQRERLSPYGLAQLALAMADDDFRRVTLAADSLRVLFTRQDEATRPSVLRWYDGSARTLGAVLEAASAIEAVREATPELASRLLLARSPDAAAWGTSHETSFALAGLAAYASIFEPGELAPPTVTVDGEPIAPVEASLRLASWELPESLAPGDHEVVIETAGTAWFAIDGTTVVPLGADDEIARGAAAALHRRLEDAAGKPLGTGAHVRLGDLVRVRLFLFTEGDVPPYVAVRDRLAGGLEPVDAALATSPRESLAALLGMGPDDEVVDARAHHAMRSLDVISHRVLAPGAAVFYLDRSSSGLHELTYGVRATTVGTFVVPPAEASALYARDFVARSAMSTVVVDP